MTAAPRYTAAQAAAAAGVPLARARRYWCALGYPAAGAADLEFTESDIEMLRMMTGFVAEGAVAEPDSLRLARVLSRSIAHLAQLQVEIVTSRSGANGIGRAEVLFTADSAAALAHIATGLIAAFDDDADIRGLRVGLALGSVARHLGDVFGTTVNLASRLTVRTEPNTVLVAPAVAEALTGHPDFDLTALEPADIRGFGLTTPVLLRNKVS